MSNFVSAEWLYEHIKDDNLVIVDCRADLFNRDYGKRVYDEGHIEGACFLDVKKDLAGEVKEHGGRSPLPELETLKEKLESVGISNSKVVVAYDEAKLAGAERLWWMLKFLGHEKVYVLNGGINAWREGNFPLSKETPSPARGKLNISINEEIIIDIFDIKNKLEKKDFIIVDSRAPERYRGEVEPIDKKAGHIPGAVNYHWKDILNEKGQFKSKEELEKFYNDLRQYNEVVLQCGSGIDACGNFIAMDELGFKPKLYVGSWSDWVSYEDSPVEISQ